MTTKKKCCCKHSSCKCDTKKKTTGCGCKDCNCGETHPIMINLLKQISDKLTELRVVYERQDVVSQEPYAFIEEPETFTNPVYSVFYKDLFKKEDYIEKGTGKFPRNLIVLEDVVVIHKKNGNLELQGTYLYGEGKKKSGCKYKILTLSNFIESKCITPHLEDSFFIDFGCPCCENEECEEEVEIKKPTVKKFKK